MCTVSLISSSACQLETQTFHRHKAASPQGMNCGIFSDFHFVSLHFHKFHRSSNVEDIQIKQLLLPAIIE